MILSQKTLAFDQGYFFDNFRTLLKRFCEHSVIEVFFLHDASIPRVNFSLPPTRTNLHKNVTKGYFLIVLKHIS